MNLGQHISDIIDSQGRDKKWVSEQIEVNYRTFLYRLENNGVTGIDLLRLGIVLNIDLEELKRMMKDE